MKYTIFDIEADGLLDTITKIHCLSYQICIDGNTIESGSITDYDKIKEFISNQEILVGHYITLYDIPAMEKILGITVDSYLIDTVAISWYLYPYRKSHGLEKYGEELGVEKPKIEDWENLSVAEYIHRCEEDVEINKRLFNKQMQYLHKIYSSTEEVSRLVEYLGFKMDCLKEQQEEGVTLDLELANKTKLELDFLIHEKEYKLAEVMPRQVEKELPKVMFKKDGSLSSNGTKWIELLHSRELNLGDDTIYEKGNPGSHTQLKEWLFTLGWKPITFKDNIHGEKIPQVSMPMGGGICDSVKELYDILPELVELEGLYVAKHRIGVIKSFLDTVNEEGKMTASAHGFTNTLRIQHSKPIVNLPGVFKPYGTEIRGCITVPNDSYTMCGSDISGLEDNTKQHYMYYFDPEYVEKMRVPGFDPHIDIGVFAGMISEEDAEFFRNYKEGDDHDRYDAIKKTRGAAKTVNFAGVYGAGPAKIAETLKQSLSFATNLHTAYWKRNKAVKQVAESVETKWVGKQRWLFNPISNMWYFLKEEKDKFSTLNQGSGVFVFDSWVRKVRAKLNPLGIKIMLQYHDEILLCYPNEHKEFVAKALQDSMDENNKELNLNVDISISIDEGKRYSDCH